MGGSQDIKGQCYGDSDLQITERSKNFVIHQFFSIPVHVQSFMCTVCVDASFLDKDNTLALLPTFIHTHTRVQTQTHTHTHSKQVLLNESG